MFNEEFMSGRNHSESFGTARLWKIFTKSMNLPVSQKSYFVRKGSVFTSDDSRESKEQPWTLQLALIESDFSALSISSLPPK